MVFPPRFAKQVSGACVCVLQPGLAAAAAACPRAVKLDSGNKSGCQGNFSHANKSKIWPNY